jgi:hypothetical protein
MKFPLDVQHSLTLKLFLPLQNVVAAVKAVIYAEEAGGTGLNLSFVAFLSFSRRIMEH